MKETDKVIKYKIFFDYEKEENWINEMAQKGFDLVAYSVGKYTFEEGEPGRYLYRYEYLPEENRKNPEEYGAVLQKNGIEIIQSDSGWLVLRKKTSQGPFAALSDQKRQIRRYQTWMRTLNTCALICIVIGIATISSPLPASHFIAVTSFSAAVLLFILLGSFSSRVRKMTSENQENQQHY